jgi:hypothetical protein
MNPLVLLFFLHNFLATLFLGMKFVRREDRVFKSFGFALLLDAVAFAVWSFGVIRPESLLICVTIGAVFFLISLVFFLNTSLQSTQTTTRWLLTAVGVVAVSGIFYIGHIEPTTAYISTEGFLFFNLQPMVQMLYIFALTLTALPAIDLVASKFKSSYAVLIRYGFIAEVSAGIILITSNDTTVLFITGLVIGIIYFLLWTSLLFSKRAWSNVN